MASKMNWDNDTSKKLLEILVDQKERGYSEWNWKGIAKLLSACINKQVSSRPVENHCTTLRQQYKAYERLSKMTGLARNPKTNEVDLEKEETERWRKYLADFPRCGATIAKKGLANATLIEKVFGGTTTIGVGGCFSPVMAKGTSFLLKNVTAISLDKESEEEGEEEEEEKEEEDD